MEKISKCRCENCGVQVEFDASELAPKEVRKGPCPVCGLEMSFFDNSKHQSDGELGGSSKRLIILKRVLFASIVGFLLYWTIWGLLARKHKKEAEQQELAAEQARKEAQESGVVQNDGYLPVKDFPTVEKSYEIRESGYKSSTIITTYTIKYVNMECLELSRWVQVKPSQEVVDKSYALRHGFLDNPQDEAQDGAGNSNKSDLEREQNSWDAYARQMEQYTYFRVMRKDADNIKQWISKCQKWSQIARSEHLADGITNTFDTCSFLACYVGYDVKNSIGFVTPDTLIIGEYQWNRKQMVEIVGLTALLPQLDAALKDAINSKEAEDLKVKKERQEQLQAQQNEINRAKKLLQ